jgi:hypothetical protein
VLARQKEDGWGPDELEFAKQFYRITISHGGLGDADYAIGCTKLSESDRAPAQQGPRLTRSLKWARDIDRAMADAVGGEFEAIGILELETLKYFGLKEDWGGRCRLLLFGVHTPPARTILCLFARSKRVLKPEGKIVFSFLDFKVPGHWEVFEGNIGDLGVNSKPLNVFISKDAVTIWAEHLGLQVQAVKDGGDSFIPLLKPLVFESGVVFENIAAFGQSVCVLQKGPDS